MTDLEASLPSDGDEPRVEKRLAVEDIHAFLEAQPSFFDLGDHNRFDDFAVDASVPTLFPREWRWHMTPMRTVLLPADDVRAVIEENAPWSPLVNAMLLDAFACNDFVVRFGGRTAHDCGVVTGCVPNDVARMLRGSERAMVEAWAWCPRRGYLPLTLHEPFEHDEEFRVRITDGAISAVSTSMWGMKAGASVTVDTWNHVAPRIAEFAKAIGRDAWIDMGYHHGTRDWHLFDVNPDEGATWPGWHPERGEEIPRSLVVRTERGGVIRYPLDDDSRARSRMGTTIDRGRQ